MSMQETTTKIVRSIGCSRAKDSTRREWPRDSFLTVRYISFKGVTCMDQPGSRKQFLWIAAKLQSFRKRDSDMILKKCAIFTFRKLAWFWMATSDSAVVDGLGLGKSSGKHGRALRRLATYIVFLGCRLQAFKRNEPHKKFKCRTWPSEQKGWNELSSSSR